MINVTDATYNAMQSNTDFREMAVITLEDGTVLTIPEADIIVTGNQITSGAAASSFPLGQAMGRTYTIALANIDGKYSEYDFYGAKISLTLTYDNGSAIETIGYGTYTVITPETEGDIITISAADDMYKADVPYNTSLSFPTTAILALSDACQSVGIALQTASFIGDNYEIKTRPDCTVRELIGGIALVAGGNALINTNGRLEIRRYSMDYVTNLLSNGTLLFNPWEQIPAVYGGAYNPWDTGDVMDGTEYTADRRTGCHFLYAWTTPPTIDTDDITITGLSVDGDGETHFAGTLGYVLKVDSPVIEGNEDAALTLAGAAVLGLTFRRFSGSYIGDPTIEPMDQCIVMDRDGNAYQSLVTDVTYNVRGTTELQNSAEPRIRASGGAYSGASGTMQKVKRLIKRNLSAYDIGVQNLTELMSNSLGFYHTVEEQQDGSKILYLHDEPSLEDSLIIYKRTASGYAGSTDGGETWSYGVDSFGNAVMNTVAAKGISFDWARGGAIVITKNNREVFYASADNGDVRINFDTITLAGQDYALDAAISSTIEWILDTFGSGVVGNKIETYYQSEDPSLSWSNAESHYGDIWNNTSNNSYWVWGTDPESALAELEWLPLEEPPAQIFDNIRKHRIVYVSSTVSPPYSVGDMWYKDGRTYVAQQSRTVSGTESDTDWTPIVYREDSTTYNLDNELNSTEEIFNRLTNNGQVKGLFLRDVVVDGQTVKQLYISFDYAEGGTLKLGRGAKNYGNLVVFGGQDAQTLEELKIIEVNDDGIKVCTEGKWNVEYFTIAENIITAYSGGSEFFHIDLTAQVGNYVATNYWAKNEYAWAIDNYTYNKMYLGKTSSQWNNNEFGFADNSGNGILALSRTLIAASTAAYNLCAADGTSILSLESSLITACAGEHRLRAADGTTEYVRVRSTLYEGKAGSYYFWDSAGTDKLLELTGNTITAKSKKLDIITQNTVSATNTNLGQSMAIEPRCGNITIAPKVYATMDTDGTKYTSRSMLGGMRVLVDTGADHYWEIGDTNAVVHQIEHRSGHIIFQTYNAAGSSSYTTVMAVNPGIVNITGDLAVSGTITGTVAQTSDRRLKRNIQPVESTGVIERLKVCSYDWKAGGHSSAGLIAQDLQEVCPELVEDIGGGYLGVNYIGIIPHLISKVQEQDKIIKRQSEQLKSLAERLNRLELEMAIR